MNGFVDGEVVNLEMGDGSEHDLLKALLAYTEGCPVLVFAPNAAILHGIPTLEHIRATNVGLNTICVYGIDPHKFEASDWPDVLEAARITWMKGDKFGDSFIQFVKDGIERTNGLRGSFSQGSAR